jgi:hypothetical protein
MDEPKLKWGICQFCGDYTELEDWGAYKYCHECVKEQILSVYPEKPKRKRLGFQTKPPREDRSGSYDPFFVDIEIYGDHSSELTEIIVHETLHYTIHKLEGLRITYLFDNIAHKLENSFWLS